jgi:hypothetical protein
MAEPKSGGGFIHRKNSDETFGVWSSAHYAVKEALEKGYSIHSVKRLSDMEVFTIGDIVNYGKITKFQVDGEMMLVNTGKGWSYDLGEIRSERKPIFVTNDDVKVFEGDEYWYISPQWSVLSVKSANGFMHGAFAILSTEQAAKDWVVLNKPSLSLAELVSSGIINQGSPQYDKILKLAKSK